MATSNLFKLDLKSNFLGIFLFRIYVGILPLFIEGRMETGSKVG